MVYQALFAQVSLPALTATWLTAARRSHTIEQIVQKHPVATRRRLVPYNKHLAIPVGLNSDTRLVLSLSDCPKPEIDTGSVLHTALLLLSDQRTTLRVTKAKVHWTSGMVLQHFSLTRKTLLLVYGVKPSILYSIPLKQHKQNRELARDDLLSSFAKWETTPTIMLVFQLTYRRRECFQLFLQKSKNNTLWSWWKRMCIILLSYTYSQVLHCFTCLFFYSFFFSLMHQKKIWEKQKCFNLFFFSTKTKKQTQQHQCLHAVYPKPG